MKLFTDRQAESLNSNKEVNGVKSTPLFNNNVRRFIKLAGEMFFIALVCNVAILSLVGMGYAMGQQDATRDVLTASNETSIIQKVDTTNVAYKLPICEVL